MKVLLVDDHPLVLAALQAVIQTIGADTTVVGVDSAATAQGHGISVLPTFIAADYLKRGDLVRVLEAWTVPPIAIHAVYAQTRSLPAKTRALIDFLVERFGPQPYWEKLCSGEPAGNPE